ncbi:MAG: hypothetical protein QM754_09755 [Tepidisphaeraceae bacterium]
MQTATNNLFSGLELRYRERTARAAHLVQARRARKYLVRPRSVEELQLAAKRSVENGMPIYVLGLGANVLINDSGVDGAVFRLDDPFWKKSKSTATPSPPAPGRTWRKWSSTSPAPVWPALSAWRASPAPSAAASE